MSKPTPENKRYWTVEATNFDNQTEVVLEGFFGYYDEAKKEIEKMLKQIEREMGFISIFEYIAK